jgi:hypothetical protein
MNADGKIYFNPARFTKTVDYPVALYESLRGRYFTAETPRLIVGPNGNAWGAIYNPRNSRVNLHVSVATLNYIYGDKLTIGVNMNSKLPGLPHVLGMGVPTNTAIRPLPEPEAHVMYAASLCSAGRHTPASTCRWMKAADLSCRRAATTARS